MDMCHRVWQRDRSHLTLNRHPSGKENHARRKGTQGIGPKRKAPGRLGDDGLGIHFRQRQPRTGNPHPAGPTTGPIWPTIGLCRYYLARPYSLLQEFITPLVRPARWSWTLCSMSCELRLGTEYGVLRTCGIIIVLVRNSIPGEPMVVYGVRSTE